MRHLISPFFNPLKLIRAYRFHRQTGRYNKTINDLELKLYSKILKNDMLHYGYFDDIDIAPEFISIGLLEQAQNRYAEILTDQITDKDHPVLDVGCGMGGLSKFLLSKGISVEALTPDKNQIDYIEMIENGPICHHSRFEDFRTEKKYGTVINSESLQYLNLDETFRKVHHILLPGGRWIISDVFRRHEESSNKSGHRIGDLLCRVKEYGFNVSYERDITPNVLPTLKLVYMYVDRYLFPLSNYAEEKFIIKKAWLFYLTKNIRRAIAVKSKKEILAINPELFVAEKKYMLYVLQKDIPSS